MAITGDFRPGRLIFWLLNKADVAALTFTDFLTLIDFVKLQRKFN
ncbi:hypothetical protein [Sporomusa sp.]|nr:hypothetical protein [Sporomusa sp.]HWR42887.1 hypothetical protein [Sporomusa sp.]